MQLKMVFKTSKSGKMEKPVKLHLCQDYSLILSVSKSGSIGFAAPSIYYDALRHHCNNMYTNNHQN